MGRLPPTVWVTAEKAFAQIFGLALFAVQAPLLGPHVFGLLAAVLVFVGFWEAVPGTAAVDALISIQAQDEHHGETVLLMGGLIGLAAGLLLFGFAETLAAAFGDRSLAPVMRAMAVLPFLQALAIAPSAAAQKTLQFHVLTLRTMVSLVAGGVTGLVLAVMGAGIWALVWQALVQRGVAAIVLCFACPIRLRLSPSWPHLSELAKFALPNMASRSMSWGSGQIPRLILGFELGPTPLGLFTLATRLHDIVTQVAILPKTQVARVDLRRYVPASDALGAAMARIFLHISMVAFPLCIGGAVIMAPLVTLFLDPRWHAAILPCQILLLMGIPFVTIYVSAALLLARNEPTAEAAICTFQSVATVLAVLAVAHRGVPFTAAAMAGMAVVTAPLTMWVMRRRCGVGLRHVVTPQLAPLMAALAMGAALQALRPVLEARAGLPVAVACEIAAGVAIYVVLILATMPALSRSVFQLGSRLMLSLGGGARK